MTRGGEHLDFKLSLELGLKEIGDIYREIHYHNFSVIAVIIFWTFLFD